MNSVDNASQILRARRKELVGDLSEIERTLDAPPSKDWEDRSFERQEEVDLEALGSYGLAEVQQINEARSRLDDGSLGVCV